MNQEYIKLHQMPYYAEVDLRTSNGLTVKLCNTSNNPNKFGCTIYRVKKPVSPGDILIVSEEGMSIKISEKDSFILALGSAVLLFPIHELEKLKRFCLDCNYSLNICDLQDSKH